MLPRNVLLLGVTSFFADVASDMVVPLLPAFIFSLGGGVAFVGAVEGLAEATASVLKYASGRWADGRRRLLPLAAAGYSIAGAVRPLLALAGAPWQVLALRCTDRVGKGLRTAPRDKMLVASAPPGRLAETFSFHRGMDHLGAALGPLCATALLTLWPGEIRRVFLVAAIPGALAVIAILAVRERQAGAPAVAAVSAAAPATAGVPPRLLAAIGLFALGNSSDALLLVRARELGIPVVVLPLLWTLLHLVRAGASWPLGRLADRAGRRPALAVGWLWYAACYVGFAGADRAWHAWVLFAAYGLVAGLTEGSERALVAAAVPPEVRGRALGTYYLVSGAGLLAASLLAGALWERASPAVALGTGAALAAAAAIFLAVSPPWGTAHTGSPRPDPRASSAAPGA
ncbi:MAG: MFS transporter [Myxococcales bacterium]